MEDDKLVSIASDPCHIRNQLNCPKRQKLSKLRNYVTSPQQSTPKSEQKKQILSISRLDPLLHLIFKISDNPGLILIHVIFERRGLARPSCLWLGIGIDHAASSINVHLYCIFGFHLYSTQLVTEIRSSFEYLKPFTSFRHLSIDFKVLSRIGRRPVPRRPADSTDNTILHGLLVLAEPHSADTSASYSVSIQRPIIETDTSSLP